MGADERVFVPQKAAFPELIVPDWLPPKKGESLSEYARRFAAAIDPGVPCIIGGASFGGMVAAEMVPHLQCRACILIGSASHANQLPRIVRWCRPFAWLTHFIPISVGQLGCRIGLSWFGKWLSPTVKNILSQAQVSEAPFFHWAMKALLSWEKSDTVKVYHIHGDRDPLLPIRNIDADEVVEGGGHVISLRNGPQVNRFIRRVIDETKS